MADVLCPKCNAKGTVVVKESKNDSGQPMKFYQCTKCESIWTNSAEIGKFPIEA